MSELIERVLRTRKVRGRERGRTAHGREDDGGCEEEVSLGVEGFVREEVLFDDLAADKELKR